MIVMDFIKIKSHLNRANNSKDNYHKFRALWDAFNVMYEHTRAELASSDKGYISEREMAKHCAKKIDYQDWIKIFKLKRIHKINSIAPIFSERDWIRHAEINIRDYEKLITNLKKPITGTLKNDLPLLLSLVDLLYVVRCNQFHGFKTPEGPRDKEVFDAVTPFLEDLVILLSEKFSSMENKSAQS